MHPLQLWQSSGKVRTFFPMTVMALNWQISAHFPQKSHLSRSISGIGVVTLSVCLISGFIKRWVLGSSTSQSSSCTPPSSDTASLVAMGVLPVSPPFGWQYRYHDTYPRVMVAPHLGHFRSKQGVPIWWGTRSPQLGQTHCPPGPAAKPPDLPRPPPPCPMPLPVPGP